MRLGLGIRADDRLRLNGANITVSRACADGSIEFVVEKDGQRETASGAALISAYSQADLVLHRPNSHPADYQAVVQCQTWDASALKAQTRLFYCQTYDREPCSLSTKALNRFIRQAKEDCPFPHTPPSAGALHQWIKARGVPGRRDITVMRDRQKRGPTGSKLQPEAEEIVSQLVAAHYQNLRRRKITTCQLIWSAIYECNESRRELGQDPLAQPSESTIRRRIKAARTKENVASKFGRHVSKHSFEPLRGHVTASRPLERVVIDHTGLDIHLIDPDTGQVWGRPTLCVMIDVHTRAILSFVLSHRHPSRETLIGLFRQAVRPKSDLLQRHGIKGEWLMLGLPLIAVIDNGKEGVTEDFLGACFEQGIEVEIAPVSTPEWKGDVERLFLTIKQFFQELLGGIPGNAHDMRMLRFAPDGDAGLTLPDAERLLTDWIVNIYHERQHSALKGSSPRRAWERAEHLVRDRLVPDLDQFDSSFGEIEDRQLSRKGILLDGLTYTGPALAGLLRDLLPTVTTRKASADSVPVKVRIMPDDIGTVKIFNPVRNLYEELECEIPDYARGLPREMHRKAREAVRAAGGDAASQIELARQYSRLLQEADALAEERKRAPRREAIRRKSAAVSTNAASKPYSAQKPGVMPSLDERGFSSDDFDLND